MLLASSSASTYYAIVLMFSCLLVIVSLFALDFVFNYVKAEGNLCKDVGLYMAVRSDSVMS